MDSILTKVVAAFAPREIFALARAVALAKSDVYEIIDALAQKQRCSGESPGQAFVRFVARDPDGFKLHQLMQTMPGGEIAKTYDGSDLRSLTDSMRTSPPRGRSPSIARLRVTHGGKPLDQFNSHADPLMSNGRVLGHSGSIKASSTRKPCRMRNRATFRCKRRTSTSWSSTSRLRRRSALKYHPGCSRSPPR